eukprot:TRINITY_DN7381_c0_g3_i3.p1 TRINITY_DN7381_c0_g3~~TRINITY_DN7381_c0_g3_i3.p1  ORF type:complete len:416 (+),score=128.33 TRINITY_DN7381_c0_g3_i3:135-1382(+)
MVDRNQEEKKKIPQSVIKYYEKFRNKSTSLKSFMIMGTRFDIEDKYEVIDAVGQGAYGIVVAAVDKSIADQENNQVAIKKIEKAFEHKIFTKRTLRELRILRLLKHENIIAIRTIMLPKSREKFDDIYVVYDLMETDLAQIIRSPQALTDEHIQFFIYQILRSLKFLHTSNIMHRDLKPRNLLVNSNCDLKLCDFGLARSLEIEEQALDMTDYVATRWYRAPELLLAHKDYSPSVDIWSVGCILAELLRRKPFLPGVDTKNQLELIIDLLGTPSEADIEKIPKEKTRKMIRNMPKKACKDFNQLFPGANPKAIDLIKKLLSFDPDRRITVEEALRHEYLANLHCPEDEPCGKPVEKLDFEFEMYSLNREQLKDLIYEEILLYHFPEFKDLYDKKKARHESLITHILSSENANLVS